MAPALATGLLWSPARLHARRPVAAAPGILLLAFGARRFDEHTKYALLLALLVPAALVFLPPLADRLRRRGIPA